jgi:hypothetical protein
MDKQSDYSSISSISLKKIKKTIIHITARHYISMLLPSGWFKDNQNFSNKERRLYA